MHQETAAFLRESGEHITRAGKLIGEGRFIEADRALNVSVRCAAWAVLQPDDIGGETAPVESGRGAS